MYIDRGSIFVRCVCVSCGCLRDIDGELIILELWLEVYIVEVFLSSWWADAVLFRWHERIFFKDTTD